MDLRLRVGSSAPVKPAETPAELVAYSKGVEVASSISNDQSGGGSADALLPLAPLRIKLTGEDQEYILETAHHIIRSTHHLPSPISSVAAADAWPELRDMLLRKQSSSGSTSRWAQEKTNLNVQSGADVILEQARDLDSSDRFVTCFVCFVFNHYLLKILISDRLGRV